jgi:hypothetical protein
VEGLPSLGAGTFNAQRSNHFVLCFVVGCSTPQHWMKVDAAGKPNPVQNPEDLRKVLGNCAAWRGGDLGTLFGSNSEFAQFPKCMHDSGYTKG